MTRPKDKVDKSAGHLQCVKWTPSDCKQFSVATCTCSSCYYIQVGRNCFILIVKSFSSFKFGYDACTACTCIHMLSVH